MCKSAGDLDEREKQIVSGLSTLAAGLSGAVVGGDASSAVAGAGAGKNAVENNHLSFDGRLVLKKAEQDYASGCGGASAGSNDCQQLADKITELRKLGESVLETEHTVVGSELGPDQFTTSKPGDIVACPSGFCRVTDEVVQTSAGKEYKLVEATEAEAAGKAQQNEMAAARSEMEVKRFLSEAYESGCGGAGPGAVACQIHRSLGAANPVTGYEPTTEERVLAGASAILNTLGLVGVVRGSGLGGRAPEGAVGSGVKGAANYPEGMRVETRSRTTS
ncbi:VENN motif pre-toxin domain-containing protein [Pseudomonas sp. NPDC089554]|uniref:VENN motif pre-toxin domain-containing protein n=1 Tax=Pseudomonas sp. NPDC089554 TaxID=3390653 RepID=UPI003D05D0B6